MIACPPNSSAFAMASSMSQCICFDGLRLEGESCVSCIHLSSWKPGISGSKETQWVSCGRFGESR
jgi:hypothetical protein